MNKETTEIEASTELAGRSEFALLCDELDAYINKITHDSHSADDVLMLDKCSDVIRRLSTVSIDEDVRVDSIAM